MTTPLLNMTHFGEGDGIPLLIVHGLFGSGRNWRAIARHLSKNRHVVTVDLRNHGDSFWNDDNTYAALADDLEQVVMHLGGRVDVLGHSMGGKAAMVLALRSPSMINRLIVADIAPVAYTHTQNENIALMQSLPLAEFGRRSDVQEALRTRTGDAALAAFFAQSVRIEDNGLQWMLNLDALKTNMAAIIGFPEMQIAYEDNALFIRGSASDYVHGVGETAVAQLFPKANIHTINKAGHWLHADKPREFMSILDEYLTA